MSPPAPQSLPWTEVGGGTPEGVGRWPGWVWEPQVWAAAPTRGSRGTRHALLAPCRQLRNPCEAFWPLPEGKPSGAQQPSPGPAAPCLRGDGGSVRGRAGSERVVVGEGSPRDSAALQARARDAIRLAWGAGGGGFQAG